MKSYQKSTGFERNKGYIAHCYRHKAKSHFFFDHVQSTKIFGLSLGCQELEVKHEHIYSKLDYYLGIRII